MRDSFALATFTKLHKVPEAVLKLLFILGSFPYHGVMLVDDSEPEIDFDHLNQYVGGDASLTAEVFGMFQHQMEMWGRMLDPEADDETWEAVIHSMRGSALAVGATKLADLCDEAESLVGVANRTGARDIAVQNIDFRISRVDMEIQRWEYRQKIQKIKKPG